MAELTPERLAEIKSLLRYETSISFHSGRAKESMLLLVSEVERLRAEGLAASERTFLAFALDLAADVMASRGDEFTAEDDAALASLRRLASSPSPAAGDKQPETCACGPQMRCPNGHCSRHYMCQDCGNCCSCECAGGER